jgi:alpha-tubulin suppressor-like RCC1 family protein
MHGGQSELSLFATAMNLSSTQVSAGRCHTVILRSDGHAMACGLNRNTQCNIPPLDVAMSYIQVAAGGYHTVLLRCDGRAVACGKNTHGQCHIPPLDEGTWYTQVSAGNDHTVLLRSDGCAVACGLNVDGQCNIPPLDEGMSYIQVSAGWFHTALLRSDGCVVAFGKGTSRCEIPSLEPGFCYVGDAMPHSRDVVLQLDFLCEFDTFMLTCFSLAGEQVLRLNARCSDLVWSTYKRIACKLNVNLPSLKLVLPDGHLLASICRANPLAIVADLTRHGKCFT